jgi:hypothetical protein
MASTQKFMTAVLIGVCKRARVPRVFIAGIFTAVLPLGAFAPAYAAFDYNVEQIAPAVASQLTMADIAAILNETVSNPSSWEIFQLATTDTSGHLVSVAPLKVVQTDSIVCPYVGVYHNQINSSQFATYLGCSGDLATWRQVGQIHSPASQPDFRLLSDGSVLYAEEYNTGRPVVRMHYYGSVPGKTGLDALIANPAMSPTNTFTAPQTTFATTDGTPEFGRITYTGSIFSSTIEVTHHFYDQLTSPRRDLQAVATLTHGKTWSNSRDTTMNNVITNAGGTGKIGDREVFKVGSTVYEVVEAQIGPAGNYYDTWRLFLVNKTANTAQQLNPVLAGGAKSLGNPTLTFVMLPNGKPALVFTYFIFSVNNGATPPGGHIYVYPLQ